VQTVPMSGERARPAPSRRRSGDDTTSTWTVVGAARMRMHARVPTRQIRAPHTDPVVLVHGLGVSSRYMLPTLVLLAPRYRVFAPDLPGFGHSTKPPHTLSLAELAESLADWMSATGLDRAVLLGNSLGCQVITTFAQHHPHRLSRAVLVGPTFDPQTSSPWRDGLQLLLDAPRERPSETPLAVADYWRAGPRRIWATLTEALHSPVQTQLTHLKAPTLVVRGGRDPIVSQHWAQQVTDLLPDGTLVRIPDAPHAVNYSAAPELLRVVAPFLDQQQQDNPTTPA